MHKGEWTIKFNKLYKGSLLLNDDTSIAEKISSDTGLLSTVFMMDTRIATNISKDDGTKP